MFVHMAAFSMYVAFVLLLFFWLWATSSVVVAFFTPALRLSLGLLSGFGQIPSRKTNEVAHQ